MCISTAQTDKVQTVVIAFVFLRLFHDSVTNTQAADRRKRRILNIDGCTRTSSSDLFYSNYIRLQSIPVTGRSKAWVCGLSLIRIVGTNPAGDMDVCLLWVLCVVR